MKKLFISLLICFGVHGFAFDCAGDCLDSHLPVHIPEGMIQTWQLRNFEFDGVLNIYEMRDDQKSDSALLFGRLPLCHCLEMEIESLIPMFKSIVEMDADEDRPFDVQFVEIPSLIESNVFAKRFQLSFFIHDEYEFGPMIVLDVHLLVMDEAAYFIATCVEDADGVELEKFTQQVLGQI